MELSFSAPGLSDKPTGFEDYPNLNAKHEDTKETVKYFYDASSRQLILGCVALSQHLEAGAHPLDLYDLHQPAELGRLLVEADHPLPKAFEGPDYSSWNKPRFLKYGRQIVEIIPQIEGHKSINREIFNRASQLGIGPSSRIIGKSENFGSVSGFYKALKLNNSHRVDTMKVINSKNYRDRMLSYIRDVGDELGKRPTERELIDRHNANNNLPSLHIISRRFGTFANALELAGFCAPYTWKKDDFILWGVKFMRANSGWLPTSRDLDHFSKKGIGPSCSTTIEHFSGSIAAYQTELKAEYVETIQFEEEARSEKLLAIKEGLISGRLPEELFEGALTEQEQIVRYARYIVAGDFLTDGQAVSRLSVSLLSSRAMQETGFDKSLIKAAKNADSGEIESSALYLGVYDDLYPADLSYMDRLKIEHRPRSKKAVRAA